MNGWILLRKRHRKVHSIPFYLRSSRIITLIYKLPSKVEEFIPHSSMQVKQAVRDAFIFTPIKCVLSTFCWRQGAIKLSSAHALGSPLNTLRQQVATRLHWEEQDLMMCRTRMSFVTEFNVLWSQKTP